MARVVLFLILLCPGWAWAEQTPVRFGLTAVVVREQAAFFSRWAEWLGGRIGRPVQFVQRRSYREIMDMLETGQLDFAWICGYPFVRQLHQPFVDLVAVPVFRGKQLYRSYVIVHRDSPFQSFAGLRGRVFAYSDPDSNSGYLAPRALLARYTEPAERFFRLSFFTYSHAETIEAVAEGVADAGAVESYVWEYLARVNPALTDQTRVVHRSELFGFPPVVARRTGDPELTRSMTAALLSMSRDGAGQKLIDALALDGFEPGGVELYDGIRAMIGRNTASYQGDLW